MLTASGVSEVVRNSQLRTGADKGNPTVLSKQSIARASEGVDAMWLLPGWLRPLRVHLATRLGASRYAQGDAGGRRAMTLMLRARLVQGATSNSGIRFMRSCSSLRSEHRSNSDRIARAAARLLSVPGADPMLLCTSITSILSGPETGKRKRGTRKADGKLMKKLTLLVVNLGGVLARKADAFGYQCQLNYPF